MEPYEIVCRCKKGKMFPKRSNSVQNKNRMYYCCPKSEKLAAGKWNWGCGFFLWEDVLRRCPCAEGLCALVRYNDKGMEVCSRQGCSPAGSKDDSSPSKSIKCESSGEFASGEGSSRQCQECQLKLIQIKILEAKLEVAQSPDKHASTSSAILHEALKDVYDAVEGLSLDN